MVRYRCLVADDPVPGGDPPGDDPPGSDPQGSDPQGSGPDGAAGSDEGSGEGDPHTALPSKVESWRRRSATGAILTGFAFGLREVFEPERKDPAIVMETSGDPPGDLPVEATLDPLPARHSVVRIRPWLLAKEDRSDPGGAGDPAEPSGAEEPADPEDPADPADRSGP